MHFIRFFVAVQQSFLTLWVRKTNLLLCRGKSRQAPDRLAPTTFVEAS